MKKENLCDPYFQSVHNVIVQRARPGRARFPIGGKVRERVNADAHYFCYPLKVSFEYD